MNETTNENRYYDGEELDTSYFRDLVKKKNKNIIILSLVLLCIAATFFVIGYNLIEYQFKGPTEIDIMDIDESIMSSDKYYTFTAPTELQYLFETAYFEGEEVVTYYSGILGNELYIVTSFDDFVNDDLPTEFTGRFDKMENDLYESIKSEFFEAGFTSEETNALLFPYEFETKDQNAYFVLLVIGVLSIIVLFNLFTLIKNRDFTKTKIYKNLEKLGDPLTIERDMENAIAKGDCIKTPEMIIFNGFYCINNKGNAIIGKLSNLQWCYLKVMKQKRLFITISKTYYLVVCNNFGKRQMAQMKEKAVHECIDALASVHGNCAFGYDKTTENAWTIQSPSFVEATAYKKHTRNISTYT